MTTLNTACAYILESTTNVAGLDHLEGQTVSILANGEVLDQQTVNSGAVSLGDYYSVAHVGLPFISDFETLGIEVGLKGSFLQGRRAKIGNVIFRVLESRGGYIGPDENSLHEAFTQNNFRKSSGQNLGDTELFSGDIRAPLGAEYNGGRIFYRQYDPLPITIGAVMPEVDIGGQVR